MKLYNNILELIGKTPLVRINKLNFGCANIFAKLEYFNPAGSIKDRIAYYMVEELEKKGLIFPNKTTLIEPTSGNTGIGLALVSKIKGYNLILTMPDTMSKERQDILKAYGAKVTLTDGKLGMQGSIDKACELSNQIENSYIIKQFENPLNPETHYFSTAVEILEDTDNKIDILIAGIGTGGTICGISKKLKECNKNIQVVGVEPASSPLISSGHSSAHKIQGIGANFIPKNYSPELVDEIFTVEDENAIEYCAKLVQQEGLFCGISSGAAIYCAVEISKREENKNKNIVVILPDGGAKYLSCLELTKYFEEL